MPIIFWLESEPNMRSIASYGRRHGWLASVALLGSLVAPSALAAPAKPADGLVDSIGVNTHFGHTDTAYSKVEDVIIPRLQELGIRHLRDHMRNDAPAMEALQKRLAGMGFRFLLITQINMTPPNIAGWLERLGPEAVFAVEGPNEYDLFGGPEWPTELASHTRMLWSLIQNDPKFQTITVAGPSLVDHRKDDYPKLGDQSAYMEVGNFHWYYAGWPPSATGADFKKLEVIINRYRPVTGDKPFIVSECGYHNVVGDTNHWGTPKDVAAKYLPAMFLYHYGYGLVRSYSYELIDQFDKPSDREGNFGLLQSDGQPKPAFTALKNLISVLSDRGPEFQAEELNYQLTGDTQDVQTLLLQKRNGDFYLAFWSGKPIWHPLDLVVLNPSPQAIQLELTTPVKSIQRLKPNHGTVWEDVSFAGGGLPLVADDEVQLLRIVPQQTSLVTPPIVPPGPAVDPGQRAGGAMPQLPNPDSMPSQPDSSPPGPSPNAGAPTNANAQPSPLPGAAAGCGCAVPAAPLSDSGLVGLMIGIALAVRRRQSSGEQL